MAAVCGNSTAYIVRITCKKYKKRCEMRAVVFSVFAGVCAAVIVLPGCGNCGSDSAGAAGGGDFTDAVPAAVSAEQNKKLQNKKPAEPENEADIPTPRIRIRSGSSIVLSDITVFDFNGQILLTESAPTEFILSNEGTEKLVVTSISLSAGAAGQYKVTGIVLPLSLLPGESSRFSVVFVPASKGEQKADLLIKSNDKIWPLFRLRIKGQGV
ncbi:MAG: choice-of-anchor D domain-containing protein [Spirochaetota bacterium]